jgi:hypothetical protein
MRSKLLIALIASAITTTSAQKHAPVDKPHLIRGGGQYDALERAIAPYVARARATYPTAKKRFLAGLPPNHLFTVWLPLDENDKKTGEYRREYVFVVVEKISGGRVYGRINNKLLALKTHRYGGRVAFPESKILNWCIVRPDGSEEGNYVGNFLDYWRPPKR